MWIRNVDKKEKEYLNCIKKNSSVYQLNILNDNSNN